MKNILCVAICFPLSILIIAWLTDKIMCGRAKIHPLGFYEYPPMTRLENFLKRVVKQQGGHMATEGKVKYDILRNEFRRMIAEGKFGPKTTVEVQTVLEKVRGKDEDELAALLVSSKARRATVKEITGCNGKSLKD